MSTTEPIPVETTSLELVDFESQPKDKNPCAVYLGRLSPTSRRTMRSHLEQLAILVGAYVVVLGEDGRPKFDPNGEPVKRGLPLQVPWHQLTHAHTTRLIELRREQLVRTRGSCAPSTLNCSMAALRGVLEECWDLGLMTEEERKRASKLKAARGSRLLRGRSLDSGELRALASVCEDASPSKTRDAALVGLLYSAGLRRAEAVGLTLADYNTETGTVKVRGKGDKERTAHLANGAKDAMDEWLKIRGHADGPLLNPIEQAKGEEPRPVLRHMTAQAAYFACKRRAKDAGLADFACHDLRRTFAGDLLDAGEDLSTVQELLGHSSPATTARYDRRPEAQRRKAAQKIHFPYRAAG